jgi:hypothetical protein
MLYRAAGGLCHLALVAATAQVSALVLLASSLPGHAKLRRDLRPADALTDGRVDEHREFCLGIVSLETHQPDSLKQVGIGELADATCRWLGRGCTPIWLQLPGTTHLLPRFAHANRMRGGADTLVLSQTRH